MRQLVIHIDRPDTELHDEPPRDIIDRTSSNSSQLVIIGPVPTHRAE